MPSNGSVAGKTVLITGAARGIGAETARRLARDGARVGLLGLEPQELERVAAECGPDAVWAEADVTDWDALERAVAKIVAELGGLDAVVANAGIGGGGPIHEMDREIFERVVEVNLMGVWRTVRVCLPHVMERRGYVLIVASVAAIAPAPLMGPYCVSKSGVEAFGNVLRLEMAHHGVDVGVAYFSWLDTDLVRGASEHRTFKEMRTRLPRFAARTYPVSAAASAIAAAIEHRTKRIVVPGWVRAMLLARGLLVPAGERAAGTNAADAEALYEAEVRERGADAAAPVGPGGRAAMEAGRARARDRVSG